MKLVQKRFFRGIRTFEISDTVISVTHRTFLKEKQYIVELHRIKPGPVVNKPYLEFYNVAENGPGLSLFIDKPDSLRFTAFIDELKQRIPGSNNTLNKPYIDSPAPGIAANFFGEPPEFDDWTQEQIKTPGKPINVENIQNTVDMLQRYLNTQEINPLLDALKKLESEPQNESYFRDLVVAFNDLGSMQGAVLTYAPYIGILLSDDPFGRK